MTMRQLDTRFWSDNWVRKLNALDRYAFIYLLTNDHSSWCGIYELPLSVFAFESGIDERDLQNSILPKLEPKVFYIDGWVYVSNFVKYHDTGSPASKKGIENALKNIPTEISFKISQKIDSQGLSRTVQDSSSTSSSSSSSSSSYKKDFSNEKSSCQELEYEKVKQSYKSKTKLAYQKGIQLKKTPRSEKKKDNDFAMYMLSYYRDRASEIHGMQFFKVKDESRNKAVRKLIIRAQKECELKDLIDWWLDGAGEWAGYEPEPCFSTKSIERFNNKNKRKQPKKYTFKKDGTIIIS